jgi:hypothetical protein
MSGNKPHLLFWQGFWKGIGGFCAIALCTYLASLIPQWRQPVIDSVLSLAPPNRLVWPICLSLYLSGFLCLFLAYRIPGWRLKRQIADGTVIEAIGPFVPFRSQQPEPPKSGLNKRIPVIPRQKIVPPPEPPKIPDSWR